MKIEKWNKDGWTVERLFYGMTMYFVWHKHLLIALWLYFYTGAWRMKPKPGIYNINGKMIHFKG